MIATVVISLILAAVVAAVIYRLVKMKRSGQCSCGCDCSGCGACRRRENKK